MIEIFHGIEQGSDEWFRLRMGIPTASMFHAVLAKGEGKTRRAYLCRLASEIVTGEPGETYKSTAMERGNAQEEEARQLYALMSDNIPNRVTFVKNDRAGCSPDSLIGEKGGLEVKTQRADLLIDTIFADKFPTEHRAQVQGNLWICEREWWDLTIYSPKMPFFVKRAQRDEPYIKMLSDEVDRFNEELAATVERLRSYGLAA